MFIMQMRARIIAASVWQQFNNNVWTSVLWRCWLGYM